MRTAAKTAALMAILTLGTKVLGFMREIFLAAFFGTSYVVDAYVMASAIPGILFAGVFTSVAVSYMPIFSRIIEEEGIEEGDRFTSEAITLASSIAFIVALAGIIFSRPIVSILAKGFTGETAQLTVFYLRVTFAYVIFTAATGLLESYLQYKGTFLKPVLSGYLQSGFVLIAIIVSALYSHYYLAFGLLIGSFVRLIALIYFAKEKKFKYRPTLRAGRAAKEIVVLALPVFVGSTVNQINSFVDKMLASGLVEGSVSALNYGYLLINMITALTISVVVTIIYPRLTKSVASGDLSDFNLSIKKGLNIILIISLPCSFGAILYSNHLVSLVYERGKFDAGSTDLTAGAFTFYAVGLAFIALNALLVKAYYAMEDMKTPVICGVFGAVVNISLNLLLVGPMAHRGLALATSIAAIVNAGLLYYFLVKKYPNLRGIADIIKIAKIFLSSLISISFSWLIFIGLRDGMGVHSIVSLGAAILSAGLIYLVALKLSKVEELSMLRDLMK